MYVIKKLEIFVNEFKNKNEKEKNLSLLEIKKSLEKEYKELSTDMQVKIINMFGDLIIKLLRSSDVTEHKIGLTIVNNFVDINLNDYGMRSKILKELLSFVPIQDLSLMELNAIAFVKFSQNSILSSDMFDHEIKKAKKYLTEDQLERKTYTLVLYRECAKSLTSMIFPYLLDHFHAICGCLTDTRSDIRSNTILLIRDCFKIFVPRESRDTSVQRCYETLYKTFSICIKLDPSRTLSEDMVIASLNALREIVKVSIVRTELFIQNMRETYIDKIDINQENNDDHSFHLCGARLTSLYLFHCNDYDVTPSYTTPPHSPICYSMIQNNYNEIVEYLMRQFSYKNPLIIQNATYLLCIISAHNKEYFISNIFKNFINNFLSFITLIKDRNVVFLSIAILANEMQEKSILFIPNVLEYINNIINSKEFYSRCKRPVLEPLVLGCLSILVKYSKKSYLEHFHRLFICILENTALTPAIVNAITVCYRLLPSWQTLIQSMVQVIIYRSLKYKSYNQTMVDNISCDIVGDENDPCQIILALRTIRNLGSFDTETISNLYNVSQQYMNYPHKIIRLDAAKTCLKIIFSLDDNFESASICSSKSQKKFPGVRNILKKLITTGVTDIDVDIRFCILSSMFECHNEHLSNTDILKILFIALRDESIHVREVVIRLIGSLSSTNPEFIFPILDKILFECLTDLTFDISNKNKEFSSRILSSLIAGSSRIALSCANKILNLMLPKISESSLSENVVSTILTIITDLSYFCGEKMIEYVPDILEQNIKLLSLPGSSDKKEKSIMCIILVIRHCGYFVSDEQLFSRLYETLFSLLKCEYSKGILRLVTHCLGSLGARDPYRFGISIESGIRDKIDNRNEKINDKMIKESIDTINVLDELQINSTQGSYDEFYAGVIISILLKILMDKSLRAHHSLVVEAIQNICIALGNRGFKFLSQIFPCYISIVKVSDSDMKKILLEQLGKLTSIAKSRIMPYLHDLFTLINEIWSNNESVTLYASIIKVIEYLVISIPDEASHWMPHIIPKMTNILISDRTELYVESDDNQLTTLLLSSIQRMAPYLKDNLFLIVPALISGYDGSTKPLPLQVLAINTLQTLLLSNDLNEYVSSIVFSLIHVIDTKPPLHSNALGLLMIMFEQLPIEMKDYIDCVNITLNKNRINNNELERLIYMSKNMTKYSLNGKVYLKKQNIGSLLQNKREELSDTLPTTSSSTHISNLKRAWQTSQRVSKEDWIDWLSRLTHEMVKESPSIIIRFCSSISQSYGNFSRSIFNYSFFSCWKELNYTTKEDLSKCLNHALKLQDTNEIVLSILNLAEFMEHTESDDTLPFDYKLLAKYSYQASAFVKSLRYNEESLRVKEGVDILESLIGLNTLLNNSDAAKGVLEYARNKNIDISSEEKWYEKLHDWDNALLAYEKQIINHPDNKKYLYGKMRCLEALCEWEELDKMVTENWAYANEKKVKLARMGCLSCIGTGNYKKLKPFMDILPKQTFEGSLYRGVYHIYINEYEKARALLDNSRDLLENELSTIVYEPYERGYRTMVTCQMLTELDEIINLKLFPLHKNMIKDEWSRRIRNCQRVVADWQKILDLRSIVLDPKENIDSILKFSGICRKLGRFSLCRNAFKKLLTSEQIELFNKNILPEVDPSIAMSYIKYIWASDDKHNAFNLLSQLSNKLLSTTYMNLYQRSYGMIPIERIVSKTNLKLGLWSLNGDIVNVNLHKARDFLELATHYDKNWHKAWHIWAKLNYEIVLKYKRDKIMPNDETVVTTSTPIVNDNNPRKQEMILSFALSAVKGFFKSLQLSEKTAFQDALRLMTLWFEFGEKLDMFNLIEKSIKSVKMEVWIRVIPQLIARIDTPKTKVRKIIQNVLIYIGSEHPQSFIYPLMLSAQSNNEIRKLAANEILKSVTHNFPGLVEQAAMISSELVRVSILWHEELCDIIEKASVQFFTERNITATLSLLDKLHSKILNGPETPDEISFCQNYGLDLSTALQYRYIYNESHDIRDLLQAWNYYYSIFRRLSKQVSMIESIELQRASPKLLRCSNLILAIPGTYQPHTESVYIQHIYPSLKVIGSQQKPRKLTIKGTNGRNYDFLLKGHEDLRQDERVMQLFGLLNNILINNQETSKRQLEIKRYSVTPLSTDSGLIGWVPECDTINSLIKDYRTKKNINVMLENKILSKMYRKFETLDLLHKVELFHMVIESTPDDDLAQSLWQKSMSAEIWFTKRRNFTRSLALMSMVGYILGLGDRHPSNIMQERTTGRIIHIDFGDCFEVTMKREKFPEKVPFRLTRMLQRCMEVTGIEGTFRITCIEVMEVLRENKDSLLAVLEAFIYDPLLNWRLLDNKDGPDISIHKESFISSSIDTEESIRLYTNPTYSSIHTLDNTANTDRPEALNKKAVSVVNRVQDKLNGSDFEGCPVVDVNTQVDLLIREATSIENLSQGYIGWCPYW